MTGKIFKESSDIYEDQAKVLFDYYKKAAEKIVEEEIEIENKVKDAEEKKSTSEERRHKHKVAAIVTVSISGAALLAGILCFFLAPLIWTILLGGVFLGCGIAALVNNSKRKSAIKDFNDFEEKIKALDEAKKNIRRDYKVSKLGVAYVPVATKVPFEGKSLVVDHTGTTSNTNFSLSVLHQPDELKTSLENLEDKLNNIPIVEGNEDAENLDTSIYSKSVQNITMHNYMGGIDRDVRNISYLLSDSDTRSVSLPLVAPESQQENFLNEFATDDVSNKPVVKVFGTDGFDEKLDSFTQMSDLKKQLEKNTDGGNSNYFKSLIKKLGDSVQIVSRIKTASTTSLLDYTNSILAAVLKSGYNQYSAQLEAEELTRIRDTNFNYQDCVESYHPFELKESSKVRYDIYNQNWVAEDGTKTIMPFGINQIEEEVLMPLINNLMNETRVERLKIYNNIKDQKLSYLNKWHQDVEAAFRDNRKTGQDLITQITNAYAEYSTAHNTYLSYKQTQSVMKKTGRADVETKEVEASDEAIKEIEESVESCREVGDAFQLYMRQLQSDINAASEKFGFVEYFEGSLRDGESKKVADSIIPENLQNLDERRKKIIPVSTYFATYAELPPAPSVEEKLNEDFALDLQAIANAQIARIDEENASVAVPSTDGAASGGEEAEASEDGAASGGEGAEASEDGAASGEEVAGPSTDGAASNTEETGPSQDGAPCDEEDSKTDDNKADVEVKNQESENEKIEDDSGDEDEIEGDEDEIDEDDDEIEDDEDEIDDDSDEEVEDQESDDDLDLDDDLDEETSDE